MTQPSDADLANIGTLVADRARDIFYLCHAESDFCIQYAGPMGAIFGGTNRLNWSPRIGFSPDRPYCTKRFLKEYDNL